MLILYWTVAVELPVPLQGEQNYLIFLPSPPQEGQVVCIIIIPCLICLTPEPLQELHSIGLVPAFALDPLHDEHTSYFLN